MQTHFNNYNYILITPAFNEEAYIERTIQSVISQTILPKKWIIVSDGSIDRTDEIVNKYISQHSWIKLLRMPKHRDRHFAAKVRCFNAGYQSIKDEKYDIIGNLDADVSFEDDYFEFLLNKFAEIPELGVAGTPFLEGSLHYDYRFTNIEHVSGACQLFKRECFESIGGYVPIKNGGIDLIAVTTARMKGWTTKTFTEKTCFHHRTTRNSIRKTLIAKFKYGRKDYYLGSHPAWILFRTIYQMGSKPYFIGGLSLLSGYIWAFLIRTEKPISRELIKFQRHEQMQRLRKLISRYYYKNEKKELS